MWPAVKKKSALKEEPLTENKVQQKVDQGELRALHGKGEENEASLVPWG